MNFGINSKYSLKADTELKVTRNYSNYIVPSTMPTVYTTEYEDGIATKIKNWFATDDSARVIAERAGLDYNDLISSNYTILLC